MARPLKKGLEYFPFDVGFFDDRKIKELRGKYGADGIILYTYLLCLIYKENGYYAKLDDGFDYVVSADLNMNSDKIGQIINFLCERSLFDSKLFASDKVLTSHGIQIRFQEAVKGRAAKKEIEVGDYWLLERDETKSYIKCAAFSDLSDKNGSNSENNFGFYGEKPYKEKESKTKKNIPKYTTENKSKAEISECVRHVLSRFEQSNIPNKTMSSVARDMLESYIKHGMEPEFICSVIDEAEQNGALGWGAIGQRLSDEYAMMLARQRGM